MKIAAICGMSDDKVRARLLPLVEINTIEQIYLFRRSSFEMEKVKTYSSPALLNWSLFLSEIYRFIALFFICLKEKPDYIYGIYFVPHGIYAAIVGFLLNIPVIQEIIGTDRLLVTKSKIYQRLLSQAERIGVRGTASRDQLSEMGIPKEKMFISFAVNAIDFNLFKPDQSSKKYDLIYCGRLDQNKQINLLLDAFFEINKQNSALKLILVGDGPEKKNLEMKVKTLNINEDVTFAGKQDYKYIPSFLNKSRIFVMASAFEGLPVAMLEALSCGLPVIVPDIGDISDIAKHGYNAWIIKENNLREYQEAIEAILNNSSFYQKLQTGALETREKFIKTFTVSNAQDTWKDILECKNLEN
ncbi:MAG: glycosyltransferase family 4 protein [Desulfobacterales bacterium]